MKRIEQMNSKELQDTLDRLEEDLKAHPSTPMQTLYFNFCKRNIGYDWVDIFTGKRMNKADMWSRFYGDERSYSKHYIGIS